MKRIKFQINIPSNLKKLNDVFNNHNVQLFVCGGAVRDALLKKQPKDWDVVSEANPTQIMDILRKENIKFLDKDLRFGVIRAYVDGEEFEIVTTREDIGKGRRPDSVKFTNLKSDASRRDLTINSLYYDMNKREIIDYFGGVDDILKSRVRTVGNPTDRFEEDRLRCMRTCRFAGINNSEIDATTNDALLKIDNLNEVSKERIKDEFFKSISKSKSVKYVLYLFNKYGFLKNNILPEFNLNFTDRFDSHIPTVIVGVLLKDNKPEEVKQKLNKLTYSTDEIKQIIFFIKLNKFDIDDIINLAQIKLQTNITNKMIIEFGKSVKLQKNLIQAICKYKYEPDKLTIPPGKEYGDEIRRREKIKFKTLMS